MKGRSAILTIAFALSACASQPELSLGAAEPRWSQRPDEVGLLPVGRVLSVLPVDTSNAISLTKPAPASIAGLVSVQSDAVSLARAAGAGTYRLYLHRIQLTSGEIGEAGVEYRFAVGDCIAIRKVLRRGAVLVELVAGLPDACQ